MGVFSTTPRDYWLHIEVSVDQHGRLGGIDDAFGIDEWQADFFDHLRIAEAHGSVEVGHQPFGGAPDVGMIIGNATDAGDADERFEFFEEALAIARSELEGSL